MHHERLNNLASLTVNRILERLAASGRERPSKELACELYEIMEEALRRALEIERRDLLEPGDN